MSRSVQRVLGRSWRWLAACALIAGGCLLEFDDKLLEPDAGGTCDCDGGTCCGGVCVDTDTSSANCGRCGNACGAGSTCEGGHCRCTAGRSECAPDGCVDTQTDPAHCGDCETSCGPQGCVDGACTCPGNQTFCAPDGCVNTDNDRDHCGSCDNVCDTQCRNGTCQ